MSSIYGIPVVIQPDIPRYELPAEVIPGVPWPAGFRDDINAWARKNLGTTNLLQDNEVVHIRPQHINGVLVLREQFQMNPRTYEQCKRQLRSML